MKKLRFTNHARKRLNERLPIPISKVKEMFSKSTIKTIYPDGSELYENGDIIFVVQRDRGLSFDLVTVYKKSTRE